MVLKDQKILVTGASKGIGKAIAIHLLEEGAMVAIHYNSGEKVALALANKYPAKAFPVKADLVKDAEVVQLMEKAVEVLGIIDSIVLNAGVFWPHPVTINTNEWLSVWRKIMTINLDASGVITKMAIEHFRNNKGGRLVYIGSRAAFRGETQDYLAYAASKGGLTSLARSVARSFGKENIKAFVVAPGFTRTAMADEFIQKHGEELLLDEIALTELTTPEDIAPLVALMCSGQMDHATGATIDINAGSYIR